MISPGSHQTFNIPAWPTLLTCGSMPTMGPKSSGPACLRSGPGPSGASCGSGFRRLGAALMGSFDLMIATGDQMTDDELREMLKRYGATGKLVRAICAAHGWRWTPHGAPPEWYDAYSGSLGGQLEKLLP